MSLHLPDEPCLESEDRTAPTPSAPAAATPLLATRDMLGGLLGELAQRHKTHQGGGWTGGLRCGLPLIDKELRGLRKGSLTILNAEPNLGKSTLANQLTYQAAALPGQSACALYATFENDPADLLLKQLSRLCGWAVNDLLDGKVAPSDRRLEQAAALLAQAPLFYLRGNAATTPDLIAERVGQAQKASRSPEFTLVVIDYLQYFARFLGGKTQYEQVGQALAALRELASRTGAALLVIGSQNREANKMGGGRNGGPSMYGGRGSGEIEYDADTMLALTAEEGAARGGAELRKLTAVKTRFGGAGAECPLDFFPKTACFEVPGHVW